MKAEALGPTIDGIQEMDFLDVLVWDNAPSHRDSEELSQRLMTTGSFAPARW